MDCIWSKMENLKLPKGTNEVSKKNIKLKHFLLKLKRKLDAAL